MEVKVYGKAKLMARLVELRTARLADSTEEHMKEVASLIRDDAKSFAPVDTGSLKKSIRLQVRPRPSKHKINIGVSAGGYVTNPKTKRKVDYACIYDKNAYVKGNPNHSPAICSLEVGEQVLSQDGLLHPIEKVFRYKAPKQVPVITLEYEYRKGKTHALTITPNHMIFCKQNGYICKIPAKNLKETDIVFVAKKLGRIKRGLMNPKSRVCVNCGITYELIDKSNKKFCSQDCKNEYWNKGNNPHIGMKRTDQAREHMQKAALKKLSENPELHPNYILSQKGFVTTPEEKIKNWLESVNLAYQHNALVGRKWVDFLIKDLKLIIEVDGGYWHSDQQTDIERDKQILKHLPEYTIFHMRFGDKRDIIPNLIPQPLPNSFYFGCNPSMNSFVNYSFFEEVPLLAAKRWIAYHPYKNKTLYDLQIKDVHSYVASGLLVSNSYQEFGTSKTPPQPYMSPAIEKNKDKLPKMFRGRRI